MSLLPTRACMLLSKCLTYRSSKLGLRLTLAVYQSRALRAPASALGISFDTRPIPWPGSPITPYRVAMDPRAQEDIAATAAAHRELGPGFEEGLAEGLVERIGAEIDKRVDSRLGQRGNSAPAPAAPGQAPSVRPAGVPVAMALGSMLIAVLGTVAAMKFGPSGSPALAALIWVVIGVVNVAYARRR
jgi:hypothetical protein